jgi:methionyl-tRNA formyltransferase
MRLLILTQNDPFYLAQNLDYLIHRLPKQSAIVGCLLFDVSPFGKKESFLQKTKKTYQVFGIRFFTYYTIKFLLNKLNPFKRIIYVLKKRNIPLIKLQKGINHSDSLKIIHKYQPDLLISIAGNQIFKKPLIDLAPKGCINLHTALLPKYRGLMPSFWVLKNNEKKTGVSVFFVDEGIDSGPIIVQKEVEIQPNESQQCLIKRTKKIGMDAIIEAIEKIRNNNLDLLPNNDTEMTYYTFPTKEDVREFRKAGKKFL